MKRFAILALSVCSLAGLFAVPAANAAGPSVCVHLHGSINGTPIDNDTCLPPA